jgi:hypothetical protein
MQSVNSEIPDRHSSTEPVGEIAGAGERSAVELKSGQPVANSGPVLRRPTTPATAGRKPAARPTVSRGCEASPLPQLKGRPGFGAGSPEEIARERASASGPPTDESAGREAPALDHLDSESIARLRALFELLDRWDREAQHEAKIM